MVALKGERSSSSSSRSGGRTGVGWWAVLLLEWEKEGMKRRRNGLLDGYILFFSHTSSFSPSKGEKALALYFFSRTYLPIVSYSPLLSLLLIFLYFIEGFSLSESSSLFGSFRLAFFFSPIAHSPIRLLVSLFTP